VTADDESKDAPEARDDEFAEKLASLSEDKRQTFDRHVTVAIKRNGSASDTYRSDLARALGKGLPSRDELIELEDHRRREDERVFEQSRSVDHTPQAKRQDAEPLTPSPDSEASRTQTGDPMEGVKPHGPPRDYDTLRQTHETVAAETHGRREGEKGQAGSPLSKEELQQMAGRCGEIRKAEGIEPTPGELRERDGLLKMQAEGRAKLVRQEDQNSDARDARGALLEHQQLAERVGLEAQSLTRHMRRQGDPRAENFDNDARRIQQTGLSVYRQRQSLERGEDRVQEASRSATPQDQQRQSDLRQAALGGTTITSEQRAGAAPDIKETLDRTERTQSSRGGETEIAAPRRPDGPARPGTGRPGGRAM
jgi:hypothetical protein